MKAVCRVQRTTSAAAKTESALCTQHPGHRLSPGYIHTLRIYKLKIRNPPLCTCSEVDGADVFLDPRVVLTKCPTTTLTTLFCLCASEVFAVFVWKTVSI